MNKDINREIYVAIDTVKSERVREFWRKKRVLRNSRWITDSNGVVRIPMSKGLEAIIDVCDASKAMEYTWTPQFSHKRKLDGVVVYYAQARIPGGSGKETIFLHNLIMKPPEGMGVDHKDRYGLNCVRDNLRYCTPSQNAANRIHIPKVRPYRGVYKDTTCANWVAKVMVNGKYIIRCGFKTAAEAALGYNELALEHHGEFAILNVIED